MRADKLQTLADAGLDLAEIAAANERIHGWRPSTSAVSRKLRDLDIAPRRMTQHDLVPWSIRPEHRKQRLRYMLQAESRRAAGREISDNDRRLISLLHDLLFGRGTFLVVTYHPAVGFCLIDWQAGDNIIRRPAHVEAVSH